MVYDKKNITETTNVTLPELLWVGRTAPHGGYVRASENYITALQSAQLSYTFKSFNASEDLNDPSGIKRKNLYQSSDRPVIIFDLPAQEYCNFLVSENTHKIACTVFETNSIPEDWVEPLNEMDQVWVPSQFNYDTFISGGVRREKLRIIPHCLTIPDNLEILPPLDIPEKRAFMFLNVIAGYSRKDIGLLLRSYYKAFKGNEEVCLVLKTRFDKDFSLERLKGSVAPEFDFDDASLPKVIVMDEVLTTEEMWQLYKACDAYATTERAKGWDYPAMESMACGKPVVSIDWSGSSEYIKEDNAFLIPTEGKLIPVDPQEVCWVKHYEEQKWPEVAESSVMAALQNAYERGDLREAYGAKGAALIREHYSPEAVGQLIAESVQELPEAVNGTPSWLDLSLGGVRSFNAPQVPKEDKLETLLSVFKHIKKKYNRLAVFTCGSRTRNVIEKLYQESDKDLPLLKKALDENFQEAPAWLPSSVQYQRFDQADLSEVDAVLVSSYHFNEALEYKLKTQFKGKPVISLHHLVEHYESKPSDYEKLKESFRLSLFDIVVSIRDYSDKYTCLVDDLEFIEETREHILAQYKKQAECKEALSRLAMLLFLNDRFYRARQLWEEDIELGKINWFQYNKYAVCLYHLEGVDAAKAIIEKNYALNANARNGYFELAFKMLEDHLKEEDALALIEKDFSLERMRPDAIIKYGAILINRGERDRGAQLILDALNEDFAFNINDLLSSKEHSVDFYETLITELQKVNPSAANQCKEQYAHYLYRSNKMEPATRLMQEVYLYKYEDWRDHDSWKYLKRVNFEISAVCNLHCKFCTFANGMQQRYIELELFEKTLREIASYPVKLDKVALYMSGESLIHPKFIQILEVVAAVKKEHPDFRPVTYLHTNGTLWKPAMHDKIMKTGALTRVIWSIDGVDADSFETMRPGGKYDKVMDNFEYFLDNCEGVEAWVNNLVEPKYLTREKDERMVKLFHKADQVMTSPPRNLNAADLGASKYNGITTGLCSYLFDTAVITTDGKMSLCCVDLNAENAFDDLYKKSFAEVYFGKKRKQLLKMMADHKRGKLKGCKDCTIFNVQWFEKDMG